MKKKTKKLKLIAKDNPCRCGSQGTVELHICPYSQEINGDSESKCNCCANCENECCMDI